MDYFLFERKGKVKRLLFIMNGMLVTAEGKVLDYIHSAFDVRRFIYPAYEPSLIEGEKEMTMLTRVAESNLFTMACASQVDPRQIIPSPYTIPPRETLDLRARLILEEALFELLDAMGYDILVATEREWLVRLTKVDDLVLAPSREPDLEKIIDACSDAWYVICGTLVACGVADSPHLDAVCKANDAKFPNGKATVNERGKFQKPEGWQPPNHTRVKVELPFVMDLATACKAIREARWNANSGTKQ